MRSQTETVLQFNSKKKKKMMINGQCDSSNDFTDEIDRMARDLDEGGEGKDGPAQQIRLLRGALRLARNAAQDLLNEIREENTEVEDDDDKEEGGATDENSQQNSIESQKKKTKKKKRKKKKKTNSGSRGGILFSAATAVHGFASFLIVPSVRSILRTVPGAAAAAAEAETVMRRLEAQGDVLLSQADALLATRLLSSLSSLLALCPGSEDHLAAALCLSGACQDAEDPDKISDKGEQSALSRGGGGQTLEERVSISLLRTAQQQLLAVQTQLEEERSKRESATTALRRSDEERRALEMEKASLDARLKRLTVAAAAATRETATLKRSLKDARMELENTQRSLTDTEGRRRSETAALRARCSRLEEQEREMRAVLEERSKEKERLLRRADALELRMREAEAGHRANLKTIAEERKREQRRREELQEQLTQVESFMEIYEGKGKERGEGGGKNIVGGEGCEEGGEAFEGEREAHRARERRSAAALLAMEQELATAKCALAQAQEENEEMKVSV